MRFTMLFQFAVLRNVSFFAEHLSNVLNYFYLKSMSNFGLFYLIITTYNNHIITSKIKNTTALLAPLCT